MIHPRVFGPLPYLVIGATLLASHLPVAVGATGYLQREDAQTMSKVCYYDVLGETHALNVAATDICPVTQEFDAVPRSGAGPRPGAGGRTGFLKEERQQALSKLCVYDVLGEIFIVNVGAAEICPVNYNF